MGKLTAAKRASAILGGPTRLAEIAGVTKAAAAQWLNGDRPIPAERAPVIAAECAKRVEADPSLGRAPSLDELCPKVPWHMVPPSNEAGAG